VLTVLGYVLFTYYWFVVVAASLLLLLGIIGSISLTFNNVTVSKKQVVFRQMSSSFDDLLKFKRS